MKIVITGTSGFLGQATTSKLIQLGYQVKKFSGDVTKINDWQKNLKANPEVVIHLAGIKTETKKDFAVNTQGTENFFLALKKISIKPQFIFASSQAASHPTTIYAQSKYQAEKIIQKKGKKSQIKTAILRFSIILGPGVRKNSGMSGPLYNWTDLAFKNQPILIYGNGKQTCDFVSLKDAVNAIILVVNKNLEGRYNVGGGKRISVLSLAKIIKKYTKAKSRIIITGKKDSRNLFSDINKLKKEGWKPQKSIEKSVYEFIQNFSLNRHSRLQ